MRARIYAVVIAAAVMSTAAQAAFIVEARFRQPNNTHIMNPNFECVGGTASVSTSGWSTAWGCRSLESVLTGTGISTFKYYYTPGVDEDNLFPPLDQDLGNGNKASGVVGGATGFYNVYITWPPSTNVPVDGCDIIVSNDGEDVVNSAVLQKTIDNVIPAGGNNWLKIADRVELTEGIKYSVTQIARATPFCGQRGHGVMWEAVEPDLAPVLIEESDGSTDVTEGGETDTYTVVLTQQPTCDLVYVTATANDPNNIRFVTGEDRIQGPLTLTFTPDNWDIPQTVEVEAFDDLIEEFDHMVIIRHTTEPNSLTPGGPIDPAFVNGFAGYVKVNITDNEAPDVRIVETGLATTVGEDGTTDTYSVALLYRPTAAVVVTATADEQTAVDSGGGPAASIALTFDSNNWSIPQTVTVWAIDDDILEYEHTGTISHTVSSADSGYDGIEVRDVIVHIQDNECKAWGIAPMDFNEDCVVDIADLAEFASWWLSCTQPYAENCVDLR